MFTDIHCHILPGIDDGAKSFYDSVEMACLAVESGIGAITATSHSYGCGNDIRAFLSEYPRVLNAFRDILSKENIPLKVYGGMEYYVNENTVEFLYENRFMTLNGSKYVLTEYAFDESVQFICDIAEQIRGKGLIPVVAHPERYYSVMDDPVRSAERLRKVGCAIQVNKGSLLGYFGEDVKNCSEIILENGLADVVASDAHSSTGRTPHFGRLSTVLRKKYGNEYTDLILSVNPSSIINDKPIRRYKNEFADKLF